MANGTIAFDTLSTSGQITGTAKSVDTDYVVNGSAKAWVLGTDAAGRTKNFNVSGGTDNGGSGDYTYAFSNNMDSDNFVVSATGASGGRRYGINAARTSANFTVRYYDDTESAADTVNANVVHGDLA